MADRSDGTQSSWTFSFCFPPLLFLRNSPLDLLAHQITDPILYDKLIRRFQTAQEREQEGKTKGYSRVLEVDLLRGEAKLSQLAAESLVDGEQNEASRTASESISLGLSTPTAEPETKEEGRQRWNSFLKERFTLGQDEDFDYDTVDADDSLDVLERRDEEEAWFNDEAPGWASDNDDTSITGSKQPQGETGIQDF